MAVKKIDGELKSKGGRPSKITPTLLDKAEQYLNDYKRLGKSVPTISGLAIHLDVHRDTLYERPEFSDTLRRVIQTQEEQLVQKALAGEFNPMFTKFMLSANHGMMEKSAVENSGEQKLTVEVVNYSEQPKP